MLKNSKEVTDSRLFHFKEKDFEFFVTTTGLSRMEINRIFKIFNDKGGILNKNQVKNLIQVNINIFIFEFFSLKKFLKN
jgi:hypothetical protein